MERKNILKVAAAITFLTTAACSTPIRKGEVMKKLYYPEDTVRSFTRAGSAVIPLVVTHPEHWDLDLKDCTNNAGVQKCQESEVEVSKEIYDSTSVGQYVNLDDKK